MTMNFTDPEQSMMSICMTCRDGREADHDGERGGARLVRAVLARLARAHGPEIQVRGVNCMSQCKRPCVFAISARNRFTYFFGDLDPEQPGDVDAMLAVCSRYLEAQEGFLRRHERPEPLQAGILGRLPPAFTSSDLVTPLQEEVIG